MICGFVLFRVDVCSALLNVLQCDAQVIIACMKQALYACVFISVSCDFDMCIYMHIPRVWFPMCVCVCVCVCVRYGRTRTVYACFNILVLQRAKSLHCSECSNARIHANTCMYVRAYARLCIQFSTYISTRTYTHQHHCTYLYIHTYMHLPYTSYTVHATSFATYVANVLHIHNTNAPVHITYVHTYTCNIHHTQCTQLLSRPTWRTFSNHHNPSWSNLHPPFMPHLWSRGGNTALLHSHVSQPRVVCTYICKYVCIYLCIYASIWSHGPHRFARESSTRFMYVYLQLCMYICKYVCLYVCIHLVTWPYSICT
jgi:hypothetical protein